MDISGRRFSASREVSGIRNRSDDGVQLVDFLKRSLPLLKQHNILKGFVFVSLFHLLTAACSEEQATNEFFCSADNCDGGHTTNTDTEPYSDDIDCPDDPSKDSPGICGCGIPDEDADGDGYMDCVDNCVHDGDKFKPGICGCGVSDENTDGDSLPDCMEECTEDPLKVEPGRCGCGIPDDDSDGDGALDCLEECPDDPLKTEPGNCGCGVDENGWYADDDSDTVPNCVDGCIDDPNKDDPGACGCGIADTDSDSDGTADCKDQCPSDGTKIDPGKCGCGVADTDSDSDGTPNCQDGCPLDPQKSAPGICGCGKTENDCLVTLILEVDDAMVNQSWPNNNYNGSSMSIDLANDPGLTYVLIKPLGLGAIPTGRTVKSATLTVTIFDGGDKISIRQLTSSFNESTVTYNKRPSHTAEFATISGKKGTQSSSVVSAVQSWVNGQTPYGLALYPTGDNGADIYSSEYSFFSSRPKFTIEYYDP